MAYVITQNCCKDASCVPVCPVDCIRPVNEAGQRATEMLYIDPETCIDCGACMEECPVDAIFYDDDLPPEQARFQEINAAYFQAHPLEQAAAQAVSQHPPVAAGALRVAIVGAGPAACYTAADLIAVDGVEVNLFERLPTPFGLIRAGVAPDHQHTKAIVRIFEHTLASERMRCYLNTEMGTTISHDELMAHHHAVIYAVGSSVGRQLGIRGEQLPGVHTAADVVGWYNGHPDHVNHRIDMSGKRAIIVGNGNVALDIARVLLMDHDQLATTDIADHALEVLNSSSIDEVVIVGRRGLRDAAFSVGEFHALGHLPDVDIVIDPPPSPSHGAEDIDTIQKIALACEYGSRPTSSARKRITFVFNRTPAEVIGSDRATGLRVRATDSTDTGEPEEIAASLIIAAIGYQSPALPGVPYDAQHGIIPNDNGRVVDGGAIVPGVYVTGWIKRGPRGVIGSNRTCAAETVAQLLSDFDAGTLDRDSRTNEELDRVLLGRQAAPLSWAHWRAIDDAEQQRGRQSSRPRLKFTSRDDMLAAAKS
ncbi:MAG: FAD-dependent oxidoreductase [Mycobacterium sp.]|uniref:FAD-dependent oxidoreductase n=1 Tax=Mycobacterium sp. TaxID=1785 RepID=UPI001ECC9064|nr:FAD-dependent oxidoreductase [Mycobacterium sp.]MBW0016692.1 FAD-dependent oxidoreductase [Mycobacterium sp.]